jgi:hypothetical protein
LAFAGVCCFKIFGWLLMCLQTGEPIIVQKQQIVKNPEISANIKESCLDGNFHVRKEDISREKRTVIQYFDLILIVFSKYSKLLPGKNHQHISSALLNFNILEI